MNFSLVEQILLRFEEFPDRTAFHIQGISFSYSELKRVTFKIAKSIKATCSSEEKIIGIYTYDDLETYASILACWITGKAYVPINPETPEARNKDIIFESELGTLLSSHHLKIDKTDFPRLKLIDTSKLKGEDHLPVPIIPDISDLAYILFTSGSTGKPKGVTINHGNLNSFIYHFIHSGYKLSEKDRFLQIYDLSFDASVHCFSVPLSLGASIYTVPPNEIKYLYAFKLMRDHELSFVKMPPSTLAYLKPYFDKIKLTHLRYCLLGGEAFSAQLARDWKSCLPNALIQNVYGPTELTVNCLIYNWMSPGKEYMGVVSIGKTFGDNEAVILDSENRMITDGTKGELCVSGNQVTPGYWKNESANLSSFINIAKDGTHRRYYKTGDVVFKDKDGDYMFCGRIDSQIQVQGFRVELGEIEQHSREFLKLSNLAAIGVENSQGTTEIHLYTEKAKGREAELRKYLMQRLPKYMIPVAIIDLDVLPKSVGGKIDRSELKKRSVK
ncbi:MAG: AMP-binding protein [Bacteroidales bacterium]|nr:AMP-binding protein [Bacteroidales bacterium]MCF8390853.1 AMP-binding protein [Bacteroidales bacterium]